MQCLLLLLTRRLSFHQREFVVSKHGYAKLLSQFSQNSMESWHMGQGICTTLGHGHIPDGRVMFNEFNLHARLPAITCFNLQGDIYLSGFGEGLRSPSASIPLFIMKSCNIDASHNRNESMGQG